MTEYPDPYWAEWGQSIITKYNLVEGPKGEWHGPCPSCGYNDWPSTRFWISEYQGLVKTFCRQCNDFKAIQNEMQHDGVWPVPKFTPLYSNKRETSASDFDNVVQLEPVTNPETYIERKQIELIGAELEGNTVIVPLWNFDQKRIGEQRICPKGTKKFNSGLTKNDAFGIIGQLALGEAWVTEGYATGVSVHMATNQPVIFALDAHTLPQICATISLQWPHIRLRVAGDNDKPGIAACHASQKPYSLPDIEGSDWNDVHVQQGLDAVKQGLSKLHRPYVKPKPPALFTHVDELVIKKPDWLMEGLIERDTLAMCFGASNSGKTFLVLDMALSVSTGRDWNGHAVQQGSVFYLAGEGGNGLARRVAAWKAHNGVGQGQAQFYKSNKAVVLSEPDAVTEMKNAIDALAKNAGTPALIVVDTLARALGGAEESSGTDMNLLIGELDELRMKYPGVTVLLVHHTGHANKERGRGASNITAAVDHEFRVEQWGEDELAKVVLTWTKQKEDAFPEPKAFVKLPIELMTPDQEEVSSIVLEYTPDMPMNDGSNGISKSQKAVLDLFDTLQEHGEVARNELRDEYMDKYATDSKHADKNRFNRNLTKLIEREILQQKDEILSRVEG